MIRRPPRSTQSRSSAASDVYKRQVVDGPQVQPDELDHDVDLLLGEAQPLERGPREVRADDLMAHEGAVRRGGRGFANVVKQRRQAQDQVGRHSLDGEQRVPEHVMRVIAGLPHAPASGYLRKEAFEKLARVEELKGKPRPW